jgi:RNA polymerase sigma factor (sigma-70 family)
MTALEDLTVLPENTIVERAKAGCQRAHADLQRRHSGYMIGLARKHAPARNLDFEEALQEVRLGLVRAVAKFSPARGVKFLSFARWEMLRGLNIADRGKCGSGGVNRKPIPVSLNALTGRDGEPFLDLVPDKRPLADEQLTENETRVRVARAVAQLKPNQRAVIEHRLAGGTLRDVGDAHGFSREYARQIEQKAQQRLRELLGVTG